MGGQYLASVEPPETELIGIAFAVVVLILAFGSVLAMGLPIAVALGGVGAGIGSIVLLSRVVTMPEDTMLLGMMIGLGVGIDYALFVVTRYREAVHAGLRTARRHRGRHGHRRPGRGVRRHDRRDLDARPAAGRPRVALRDGRRGVGHGAGHDADVDDPAARPARPHPPPPRAHPLEGPHRGRVRGRRHPRPRHRLRPAGRCRRGAGRAHPRGQRRRGAVASAGAAPPSATRRSDAGPPVEPHDPAPAVGVAGRRDAGRCWRLAAPALGMRLGLDRRGQLPRGHRHPPGLRPAGRRLRRRVQRPVRDHRQRRIRRLAGRRPGRRRRAAGRGWPPPRASPP